MTQLKIPLTALLLLCISGYGSAWAFQNHTVEVTTQDTALTAPTVTTDITTGDQQDADTSACDHSCHASAHMIAICTHNTRSFRSNNTREPLEYSQNFISIIIRPGLRPPRV